MESRVGRARVARSLRTALILGWVVFGPFPTHAREPDGSGNSAPPASEAGETSLVELLEHAEAHAPNRLIALQRRAYGPAALEGAEPILGQNPTFEFGIGPRFQQSAAEGNYDFSVALGQPLEIAGQRGQRVEAARRLGERLDAETGAALWGLRQEVTLRFRAALVARERVAVAERVVAFATDMRDIAERRLSAGDVSAVDVRLANVELAQARQAKILAEAEFRSAQFLICEVTGWPLDAPLVPRGGIEGPGPVPSLDAVLRRAGSRHPELLARHAAVEEAHARAELADREAWPTPTFGVSVAREGQFGAPENYVVLGTVSLPLPLWQRNQGERGRARVDEHVARSEVDATAAILRARIARAHSDLRAARDRVLLYRSDVTPTLDDTLSMLRRGFEAGQIPIFAVAVARERILQAQRDALNAHADYYTAVIELESAMGVELPLNASDQSHQSPSQGDSP